MENAGKETKPAMSQHLYSHCGNLRRSQRVVKCLDRINEYLKVIDKELDV